MKTKVYRYEHLDTGLGPLCSDSIAIHNRSWERIFRYHVDVSEFEEFESKCPSGISVHHKFGMSTLEGLEELCLVPQWLNDYGFYIHVVEVPVEHTASFPDGQIIYDLNFAECVDILENVL